MSYFDKNYVEVRSIDNFAKTVMDRRRIHAAHFNFGNPHSVGFMRGLCGLQNLGNTCFMNSALQCLSNLPELTEYFLSDAYLGDINEENPLGTRGQLVKEYADLLKHMWSGENVSVRPFKLKCVIGQFVPRFIGHAQHDSQELTAFLLDGLHEDLNRIKKKSSVEEKEADGQNGAQAGIKSWQDYRKHNDSVIVDLLHGQHKSTLTCNVCGKVSVKFDPFCFLSVPIPPRPLKESASVAPMTTNGEVLRIAAKMRLSNDMLNTEETRHPSNADVINLSLTQSRRSEIHFNFGLEYLLWFLLIAREWLIQPWTSWALDLCRRLFAGPISLQQCLSSFFSADYLHGDDMYKCDKCKRLRNGTKLCSLTRLPQVLIIHLKRFRNEGMYNVKLGSKVAFPLTDLDLRPFVHPGALLDEFGRPNPTKYDLCALVTHKGQTIEYGHYVAYCRNPNDLNWYEFDDANVTRVDNLEVLSQEAYILFYKQNGTLGDEDEMDDGTSEEEDEEEWVEANSSDEREWGNNA